MAGIFLSYAREDRGCVEKLAQALEQAGHQVWWDRRIESGTEFSGEIEAALNAADVVLVAWSKDSIKSRWVRDEAAIGGDSGRLLPVLIDGTQPPLGFRQFHALDLAGWKGGRRDPRSAELVHAVERKLKGTAKAEPTSPAAVSKPRFAMPKARPFWAIAAVVLLLVAATTSYFLLRGGDQDRSLLLKPTIALLPFTTASGDGELRDIAAQARASISHTLSQTGIPVRQVNSGANDPRSAGDFLLSGEVGRSGDKVVATLRLDEAAQGVTVVTRRFEAEGDDINNLPERIGVQMAGFFGGATLMILDRRHPLDPALMAELLAESEDFLAKYQMAKRVAAKAPDEPSALIGVAFYTGFALPDLPRDERRGAVAEARRAAQRALTLAPEFGDTYATCSLLHSGLAECEDQMRAGKRIDPDAPYLNGFLADMLRAVGRFDEAMEVTRLSYTHDPYNFFKIRQMLRMLEFTGDREGARELYERAIRWYPDAKFMLFRSRLFALINRADFGAMQRIEQEVGADVLPADFPRTGAIASALNSKSEPALRRACTPPEPITQTLRCMIAFAMIGDLDSAYAIADELYPNRLGRTSAETERIWLDEPESGPLDFITSPAAAPMRRDPRYLQLAQRTGLLDYWRTGRAPDFCRKQPEPICGQLLKRG